VSITTPIEGDGIVNAAEDNDVLIAGSGAEAGNSVTVTITDTNSSQVSRTVTADSSGNWTLNGSELDVSGLTNGTLTVSATQTDTAGNTSTAATQSITLDNAAPSAVSITTPIETDGIVNAAEDNDVLIAGSGAEAGNTVTVSISDGSSSVSRTVTADSSGNWTLSGSELDVSDLTNGTLTVSATQTDTAGNTSTAATQSITLDNAAPSAVTITTPIETDGIVNAAEDNDVLIAGSGAESGNTVNVSISDGSSSVSRTVTADSSGNWTLSGSELDVSGLNNGTLTVSATQTDTAGNTSTPATQSITLDNAAPSVVSITTPIETDGIVNAAEDNDVLIAGSGAESGNTVTVSISDGSSSVSRTVTADSSGNWTLSGSELDVSGLNNGTLTVSATQTDTAGNTSTPATQSITLDNAAPSVVSITTPIETDGIVNAAEDNDVLIAGSGAESGNTVTVSISDGSSSVSRTVTADSSGNWTLSGSELDVSGLTNGTLTVSATQTDTAGNTSTAATQSITLDNAAPSVLSITTPIEGDGRVNAAEDNDVLIAGSGAEAGNSVTVTISDTNNSQVSRTVTADSSGNWTLSGSELDVSSLTNGTLTVSATQTDTAGNTSTAATQSITLDNAAPSALSITTPIEGDGIVNAAEDNDVLIAGSGAEAGNSVAVTISDGSNSVSRTVTADSSGNWTLSGSELDVSALTNGTLTVSATQTDTAGNTSTAATQSIILDNAAPSAVTITTPIETDGIVNAAEDNDVLIAGSGAESGNTVTVSISDGSSLVSRTVTADSSGNWTLSGSELDVSSFNNGTLTVSATQTDTAGNTSTAATQSITLDNAAPSAVTITTPIETDGIVNAAEDNDVLIAGTGAESGNSVTVSISDGSSSVSRTVTADSSGNWTLSGSELDVSGLNNGTLTVSATQTDTAGNTSTAATQSITLDNAAPSAVSITTPIEGDGRVNAAEDNDVLIAGSGAEAGNSVTVTITDTNSSQVSRTVTADNSGNWTLSGSELDVSSLTNGTLTVSAIQTDSAGNLSSSASTTITLDNTAPTGQSTAIDQTLINASNESALSFTLSGLEGSGSFTYQISDGTNTVSSNSAVTINASSQQVTGVDVSSLSEGTLTLSVTVTDSAGNSGSAVTATVTKKYNVAPVLSGSPATTVNEDSEYSFTPTLTDTDTNDTHTFSITNMPSWASFDTQTGKLSGTPTDANVGTTENITISVNDGTDSASLAAFSLEVVNTNDAPTGQDTSFTLDEGATLSTDANNGLLTFASDDDSDSGDTLTVSAVTQPQYGQLTLNSDGTFSYVHDGSENHSDSFTYQVNDSNSASSSAYTVSLTITPVADAPTTVNDTATTDEDTAVTINLLANDSDPEGDMVSSSAAIVTHPSNGSVSITNGVATYTPTANTNGQDTFTYTVKDAANNTSEQATVTVTVTAVNDAPVAANKTISVTEDTASEATNLRALATDIEDTTPTGDLAVVTEPAKGSVSFDQTAGTFTYTPNANEVGQDTFTYTIKDSDGLVSNTATVTVNIGAVNDRPVVGDDSVTTDEDLSVTLNILANDSDVEDSGFNGANVSLEDQGNGAGEYAKATVSINTDGTLNIAPKQDENGNFSFTYTLTDSEGLSSETATVTVILTAVNDAPVAVDNTAEIQEDGFYEVNVLGNDTDVDANDSFDLSSVKVVTAAQNGQTIVNADGSITYTANTNYYGNDTFTYTVADAAGAVSNEATVTMTINSVNDAPVATAQLVDLDEDGSLVITLAATDEENDDLSFSIATNVASGSLVQQTETTWLYTPNADFNGADSFTFIANDGTDDSSEATVSITVNAVNDKPVASAQSVSGDEDTDISITLVATDTENSELTYRIVTAPVSGSASLVGNVVTYRGDADFNGSDSFNFVANDTELDSDEVTVSITIDSVNDAPTISGSPSSTVDEDTSFDFTPSANDVDGDDLAFSIVNKPNWANFDSTTGQLSGTPTNSFVGVYSDIQISVSDGTESTALSTFSITVINTNDAPVISGSPVTSVDEDSAYSFTPTASDVDVGDNLTFSISNQPSWASFDTSTGTLSGTPTNDDVGSFANVIISVSDGTTSTALDAFTITVNNTNDAPVISGSPAASVDEDSAYSFTPTASDVDVGDKLTFSITNKPSWASFDSATGTLSGTPTNDDVGSFANIIIAVSDGTLSVELPSFSVIVNNTNDAPVISGSPATSIDEDSAYSFTPTASDVDVGDNLTFSISNQPSWASFDASTGTLSGTPKNGDVGSFANVIISVSDGTTSTALDAFTLTVNNTNDAPVISGSPSASVDEDSAYSFTPTASDVDVGDNLTFSITNKPSWASFDSATGTLSGTPTNDDVGITNNVVIAVSDGTVAVELTAFNLTVNNVNDSPVGSAYSFTLDEAALLSVDAQSGLLSLATDDDLIHGDSLQVSLVALPLYGQLSLNTDGSFSYQHNGGEDHADSFTYQVVDSANATSATYTVTLTITPVADAPITQDDNASTNEDTVVSINLLSNDSDAEGDMVASSTSIVTQPTLGSVSVNNGVATYTPSKDANGTDSFSYKVSDAEGNESNTSTVTISIAAVNDKPIANNFTVNLDEDAAATVFAIRENTSDIEDGTPSGELVAISQPSKGQVSFDQQAGTFTYSLNSNENGVDSFNYTVADSEGLLSEQATVTINIGAVNDRPVAQDDNVTTDEDVAVTLNILANDSDVEQSEFNGANVSLEDQGNGTGDYAKAVVTINADGSLNIAPKQDENGEFSFTYTLTDTDGLTSEPATVTVTLTPVNDAPVAVDNTVQLQEDGQFEVNVLGNDTDVDDGVDPSSVVIESAPEFGQATITSTGSIVYVANENYFGDDTFTYSVKDFAGAKSNIASVNLQVDAINDAPVAEAQSLTTSEDTSLTITLNASDTENSALTYRITEDVTSGNLVQQSATQWQYTPSQNFTGFDSFSFVANDDELDSEPVAVSITVTAVNDAPILVGQSLTTNEDNALDISLTASDVDSSNITYRVASAPSNGSAEINGGVVIYTPDTNFNGNDSFTIVANDGELDSEPATFSVSVSAINDAPVISGSPLTQVNQDTVYSFTPNAQDFDSETLSFNISNKPNWAQFDSATGQLSGVPSRGDVGVSENIVISVSDGELTASLSAFNINVAYVNAAPIANAMSISLDEDTSTSQNFSATDSDGDNLSVSIISQSQQGVVVVQGTSFTYTPEANFNGSDSFTYSASDGALTSAEQTVSIIVNSVNDEPVANADTFKFDSVANNTYLLDVLANDTDIEDSELTIIGAKASVGSVSIIDGALNYQAPSDVLGKITLSYLIADSDKGKAQGSVNLEITSSIGAAPVITVPSDIVANATGLFTKVDVGTATALDFNNNPLAVSLVDRTPLFAPGAHLVYWQATDSQGLQSIATQNVQVNPLISLSKDSQIAEGRAHQVKVFLNGPAPVYPVVVPYTVSGQADSADHDLANGEVIIDSGTEAVINFSIFEDGIAEGNERFTISLDNSLNLGAKSASTITIVEENVAPEVTVTISQNNEKRSLVEINDLPVTIKATASDANPNDSLTINWRTNEQTIVNQSSDADVFEFSTASMSPGIYKVTVTAEDNGTPLLSTSKDVYIELIEGLAALTSQDTDGDLIPDDQEGYSDSDNDGIPDFQDAITDCNVMQEQAGESSQFLVEGEPGVCLRKGATVAQNSTGGVQLLENELPSDESALNIGGLFDFIATGLPQAGDTYSIVIPQRRPIPLNAVYRKLKEGEWVDFVSGNGNQILSATGEPGYCPPPGSNEWTEGLTEGDWCVQLQIVDGGPNDDDGIANRAVVDPGGIAVPKTSNNLPQAQSDEVTIRSGEAIIIDVLNNDSDADNDTLTITGASVDFGSVTIEDNKLVYTPPSDLIGQAIIQYSISDGKGGTSNSTATVNLIVNSAPTAVLDNASTNDKATITIDVLANDTDKDGDELTLVSATAQHGEAKVNVNGTLTYIPKVGFSGVDVIKYTLKDSKGALSQGEARVTVTAYQSVAIENKSSGSLGGLVVIMISILLIRRRKTLLPSFALITSSCLVNAQALASEWGVETGVGQAKADYTMANMDGVSEIMIDDKSESWSAGVYYQLTPDWSTSLRYIDLGQGRVSFKGESLVPADVHKSISEQAPNFSEGFALQARYNFLKFGKARVGAFMGAYKWKYKVESVMNNQLIKNEMDGTDLYYGLGVSYSLTDSLSVKLDYSHFNLQPGSVSDVQLGLSYRF